MICSKTMPASRCVLLGVAVALSGLGIAQAAGTVEVIVNNSLYSSGSITSGLNQYLSDLQAQGYTPHLTTSAFGTAADLRSYLANRYSSAGIKGAVMIGDLPIEHFERNGQFGNPNDHQRFACDLYYMDVNGAWSDSTSNGTYDTHTGNVSPEIWVSHLTTSTLATSKSSASGLADGTAASPPVYTESSLLNSYFTKNHQYRTGQLRMPQNGLAYIDDDWSGAASSWGGNLGASVAGHVDIYGDPTATTAADYKARLAPATSPKYESVLLACHSGATGHAFKNNFEWGGGDLASSELRALDPQALFYNLFACSNSDYETPGYMGGEYVFGTSKGLLSVGTTKTGSMLNFGDYYTPLGQGATFGEALLDWWQAQASGGYDDGEKDWFYGMTMIGDPLMQTEAFMVPEPTTLALLFAGLAIALGRRCLGRRPRG
jgi:hypothetical protein